MNKQDLVNRFAEREGMSQAISKTIVDMFFDDMATLYNSTLIRLGL